MVVRHEVIDIDSDADADGVVVICEKAPVDKNKQHVAYPLHWPKLVKVIPFISFHFHSISLLTL